MHLGRESRPLKKAQGLYGCGDRRPPVQSSHRKGEQTEEFQIVVRRGGDTKRRIETVVAIYAAILATATFGWQLWEYTRNRPVLAIGEKGWPRTVWFGARSKFGIAVGYEATLINKGTKPITIFQGGAYIVIVRPNGGPAPFENELWAFIENNPLPMKLGENDARKWRLTFGLKRTGDVADGEEFKGRVYSWFKSTAGDLSLEDEISLRYKE